MADSPASRRWLGLAVGAIAALLVGWPLIRLAGVALETGPRSVVDTLSQPRVIEAVWNSIWTGVLVAVLALGAGTAAALVTERMAVPARGWLRIGLVAPLIVPPFVSAFGWTQAYAPHGLTDQLVGISLASLYGPVGIVLVLAVAATPLTWLVVAGALASRVETDAEWAARASGAGQLTILRTITLPLIRPALVSAWIVAFVFAVNAFGVPAVLGTPVGFTTITSQLYEDLGLSADPAAFVQATTLALALAIMALAVVGPADALLTRRVASRTGLPAGGRRSAPGGRLVGLALAGAVILTTVVPMAAILLTAVTRAVGLAPVPANWTLDNFGAALSGPFVSGLVNSLILATCAATIVLGLAALTVGLRARWRPISSFITVGFALPGSALAVALLLADGSLLRDSLLLILAAYVAKFWALGHRQLAGSGDRLPADLLRAARASGAGFVDSLRSIAIPIVRPSLVAAWLLVFIFSLHELTMSSLLYGPTSTTLAVVVLNAQQLGDPTVTAALAVILTGLVVVAAVPLALLTIRRQRRSDRPDARA